MRNITRNLDNRSINFESLLNYGFVKNNEKYVLEKNIYADCFKVIVEFTKENQVSKVIDLSVNEEYALVDVKDFSGDFVGKVKEEYEKLLNDIIDKCTTLNVFKSNQAKKIIKYVKEKYNDDLEYLWKEFPKNAVWRNKNNNKWYGVLLVLDENKLGIESDKIIDIIDLRYQKDNIKEIIDNNKIYEGYHMNKDNWITIRLNESVDIKEIFKLIDNSYALSLKK